MSLEMIERRIVETAVGAGLVVAGYNTWATINRRAREARMPEGGDTQSILPFYSILPAVMEECGITMYASSGGLAKQALADPSTQFNPDSRTYDVVDPDGPAVQKATLWRPGECTIRDFDIRAFKIRVGSTEYDADHRFDGKGGVKEERTKQIQALLDEHARELGFEKGPEVSLFFYERAFEGAFRASPHNYATRTTYDSEFNTETLFACTGQSLVMPRGELWDCAVRFPGQTPFAFKVNSPADHLGRTLNRPIVARERDLADIDKAILNIHAKGLGKEILGDIWEQHNAFRADLDRALDGNEVQEKLCEGDVATVAHMLLARLVGVPIAPWIENGEIGKAIRDPRTWIGRLSARSMGA